MTTVEKLYQEAMALPPDDLQRLIEMLSVAEPTRPEMTEEEFLMGEEDINESSKSLSRGREMRWLAENRDQYAGQWVVIEGDQLIASGPNSREVFNAAKQAGVEIPFLVQVEPEDQLPFGGW